MYKLDDIKTTCNMRSCSKAKHYQDAADGRWTRQVKVGRSSRWPRHENEALIKAHIRGDSEDKIRALVRQLHEARKTA